MERDMRSGMTVFDAVDGGGWRPKECYRSQRPHTWALAVRSTGSRRRRVRHIAALIICALIGLYIGAWLAGVLAEKLGG